MNLRGERNSPSNVAGRLIGDLVHAAEHAEGAGQLIFRIFVLLPNFADHGHPGWCIQHLYMIQSLMRRSSDSSDDQHSGALLDCRKIETGFNRRTR